MFIRNFDSFTVCGGAEWSAAGFPLDTRASLHTERRAAVAERAAGWTLGDENIFSLTPKYSYCISTKRLLYILYISLAEETWFLKEEDQTIFGTTNF